MSFANLTNGDGDTNVGVELTVLDPARLVVAPAGNLTASGMVGGPFTPANRIYTLSNPGDVALDFTASDDGAFVDTAPASGTISPGGSVDVTVALNAGADALAAGLHTATIAFTNLTNGSGDGAVGVELTVLAPGLLAVAPAENFVASGIVGGPFSPGTKTYTLSNDGEAPLDFSATSSESWLDASPAGGTIAPGATTTVTIAFNAAANALAPGDVEATVDFRNETNGMGSTTRKAMLNIRPKGQLVIRLETVGGDDRFDFTSSTPALNLSLTTVNGAAESSTILLLPGSYVVTAPDKTADGYGLTAITCSDGDSTTDLATRSATVQLGSGEQVQCTFGAANSRGIATRAINKFLTRRAALLMQSPPPLRRRIDRLNGHGNSQPNPNSLADLSGHTPFEFGVRGDATGLDKVSFATSLAKFDTALLAWRDFLAAGDGAAQGNAAGVGPRPTSKFDVWFEGSWLWFRNDGNRGRFAIGYMGADYLISPDILIGGLVQIDDTVDKSGSGGTRVSGTGWMAGPYVTVRLSDNFYLDARAAWGLSDNEIEPMGTFSDDFETTRWLASVGLIGDFSYENWRVRPNASFTRIQERQHGYTDSLGVFVPGQTVSAGRVNVGPTVSYRIETGRGLTIEPHGTLEGVYNFSDTDGVSLGSEPNGQDDLRGRVELGVNLTTEGGIRFGASGSYDGIGGDGFESYGATVKMSIPLN